MNHKLQLIPSYLNALSLRERVMALVVIIAIIYVIFDGLVFKNLDLQYQQLQTQQQDFTNQQQVLSTELLENAEKIAVNKRSSDEIKQEISTAQMRLNDTEAQLDSVFDKLVPPTKITELLRSLLLKTNDLKLVSLNNEPVKKIILNKKKDDEEESSESESLLYEHATIIKLTGNYQQLYQYLLALEQSDWGLFWDKMHYTVTDYPQAEISLRVHTISTDEYWIGL
jgi:MSHA biogenesis protein MshJ